MDFFLLAFPALFSIINPLGGAFIFLSATRGFSRPMRTTLARWVAIHSFIILNVSLFVGAYVLNFFGISMPVLRLAGGIIIAKFVLPQALGNAAATYVFSPVGAVSPTMSMCSASHPSSRAMTDAMRRARHFLPNRAFPP